MPRYVANGLTKAKVERQRSPGRFNDGRGLYLVVSPKQGRSWTLRYMLAGKAHEIGLGSARDFTLDDARERASEMRRSIRDGRDPAVARRFERDRVAAERARTQTFEQCAAAYMAANEAGWRNPKHRAQWAATLATYAYPIFGKLPVADVDVALVMRVIDPIWRTKAETASRVRGRIESVLDWATVRGLRKGENPARWKGHLDKLLPAKARVAKVEHHASLPHAELPAFYAKLRTHDVVSARALEFLILTAARTGEVIGARWDEFDLDASTWTVPGDRMKAGREHRVPLGVRAVAIVRELKAARASEFVFPGRGGKGLSNMTMAALLERMGHASITGHGFRSTFRDWAAERTSYPREVAEAALAHTLKNKVEAAYRRSDLLENRRPMMAEWATFAAGQGA